MTLNMPNKIDEMTIVEGSGMAVEDAVVTIMLSATKISPKSPPLGGGES